MYEVKCGADGNQFLYVLYEIAVFIYKQSGRGGWHDATLLPAETLKARRAFCGNRSVRTDFSFDSFQFKNAPVVFFFF